MRKSSTQPSVPKRVLARLLAVEELCEVAGGGDTVWTDGSPRKDLTQVSAGDVAGSPPENQV